MVPKKPAAGAPADPFARLRQMAFDLERAFGEAAWPGFRWPAVHDAGGEAAAWAPQIDVFERENRLITRVDLPGIRKEDVKVEIVEGHLAISGERTREPEHRTDRFYRSEREYGRFYRAVPMPDGIALDDVKATFEGGVLEVSVPLQARGGTERRTIDIAEPKTPATSAA